MPAKQSTMRPEDDPAWASYAETVLRVHGSVPGEIDLARPIDAGARAVLHAAGLSGRFGLVTPCNPRGRRLSAAENAARWDRFVANLSAQGHAPVRVDGQSPDRQHVESGVALPWAREAVVALARDWDQSAIYWFDGDAFWVVGALTDTAGLKLPKGNG